MAGLLDLLGMGGSLGAGSGGLLDGLRDRPGMLLGLGAGIAGGNDWSSGIQQGLMGAQRGKLFDQEDADRRRQLEGQKQLAQFAGQGLDPGTMAMLQSNPEIASALAISRLKPKERDIREVGGNLIEVGSDGKISTLYQGGNSSDKYAERARIAETMGLVPGSPEHQSYVLTERLPQKRDASAAPAGYRFREDGASLEPIPGGPAEKIDGEVAGRIGLAEDALKRLGAVEDYAHQGGMTGPIDTLSGTMGWGKSGEMNRELQAGSEALTRMLTGAGMNMAEAEREAQMYLPRTTDGAADLANKVQQLRRRLETVVGVAKKGRGGQPTNPAPSGGQRSTASGVTWSVE